MTSGKIEIDVGDVSDMAARVVARYVGGPTDEEGNDTLPIVVSGAVRGPYCTVARTLPASFAFQEVADPSRVRQIEGDANSQATLAEAVIADPCTWSPELPHVYQIDVEARRGERVVAEYHGPIALRRTSPRRAYDFSNE